MSTIHFSPDNKINFTPKIVSALKSIANGGEIIFQKGEYHFFTEGSVEKFLTPTNNTNCIKQIAFPVFDMKNISIDGGDSTFVFHGNTSPFVIAHSQNIIIKNFTMTMDHIPYVLMKLGQKDENGFSLLMHPDVEYTVDPDGHISIKTPSKTISTYGSCFSLHSLDRIRINYLFAGTADADKDGLAAPHYETAAEPIEGGVYCRYTYVDGKKAIKCAFDEGENIGIITEGRTRTVIFMEEASNVTVSNVTVKRGTGMGILGQCCHNVNIDGFKAIPYENEPASITADALHFVHCTGRLDIRNCENRKSMDDFLNVHGMYTTVSGVFNDHIRIKIGHHEQALFLPYHNGDRLQVIDPKTLEIKGTFLCDSYEFTSKDGMEAIVRITNAENLSFVNPGDLIEDNERMPDLYFENNKGIDIPSVRMAGGKHYLFANNDFTGFYKAINANDMPDYWFESGRLGELIIENNRFDGQGRFSSKSIIDIGVTGFETGKVPKVHEKIIIRNNRFINCGPNPVNAEGVKKLVIENNFEE